MKNRKVLCMTMAAALCLALGASATIMVRVDFDELVKATQVVARGKCVASEARWDRGSIWTFTTIQVEETLKGSTTGQIVVRLPGGKVGHMTSTVDAVPQFHAGEEVFLFLVPTSVGDFSVLGWVQGTFRMRLDPQTGKGSVTQESAAHAVYDPVIRQFKAGGVRNMPVEMFRLRVREAMERQRKGKLP